MNGIGSAAEAFGLDNVTKCYGELAAIDAVTLSVPRGRSLAVVGPSGAGKTTLLRLIAGMIEPSSGSIRVNGRPLADIESPRALAPLVGMMQQQLDLVPQLAAKHNVQAGLLGRWSLWKSLLALVLPGADPTTKRVLERVGLADRINVRVAHLSGGEQQRVALGRVLAHDPAVVLADEPVSSLDPSLAEDLLGMLRDLTRDSGKTLVASLHIPDLALHHFERVVGLRRGRVVFDAAATDVTRDMLAELYRLDGRGADGGPGLAPE